MNERFKFDSGEMMNPHWVYKTLTIEERCTCHRLMAAGILGWNKKSIGAAHIRFNDIRHLVEEEIIKEVSLLDIAKKVVSDEDYISAYKQLDIEGGFLVANSDDKKFIRDFDWAREIIVKNGDDLISEKRYVFADKNFKSYVKSLFFITPEMAAVLNS